MLDKIKRSLFRISNFSGNELGIVADSESFEIEFTTHGSLWFFRYDCIVLAEYPYIALTLNEQTEQF